MDDAFFTFMLLIAGAACVLLLVWGFNSDEKHNDKMREQYTQCQKDGKEWVLTKSNGSLDGICVTKR